ncbi:MAG: MurR/RpiR family transcriptional regulator [Mycoplasmatales bacterium]
MKEFFTANYKQLTKMEQQTISKLESGLKLTNEYTVKMLASELKVSTTALHRLITKLGFSSFMMFKQQYIEYLEQKHVYKLTGVERELVRTLSLIDRAPLAKICEQIKQSRKILIAGYGMNHYIARILETKLQLLGYDAKHWQNAWYARLELKKYTTADLVICLSKSGKSDEIVQIIDDAKQKKIKIILLIEEQHVNEKTIYDYLIEVSQTIEDDVMLDTRIQMHLAICELLKYLERGERWKNLNKNLALGVPLVDHKLKAQN